MFYNAGVVNPLGQSEYPGQSVATGAAAASVTGWNSGPQAFLVWCTNAAYIEVGANPTATASSTPIPANWPMVIKVPFEEIKGGKWTVSALQVTTAGILYVKPLNWG